MSRDAGPTWLGLFGAAPGIDLTGEDFHRACCHWEPVYEDSKSDPEGAVRLHDHFSATVELRIAEIQPQYGLVQLNAVRRACGCMVSCDVKRDDFLAAVSRVLGVTITEDGQP